MICLANGFLFLIDVLHVSIAVYATKAVRAVTFIVLPVWVNFLNWRRYAALIYNKHNCAVENSLLINTDNPLTNTDLNQIVFFIGCSLYRPLVEASGFPKALFADRQVIEREGPYLQRQDRQAIKDLDYKLI